MEEYIPTYTDISYWQINVYHNTGGTRSKKIAIHPETDSEYFFKGSKELKSGEIRYPDEFWSEIISSKIGQLLGFKMLDYNIGYSLSDKQKIGCLSKSMVSHNESKLTEGRSYLTGYKSSYNPDEDKKEYTFQFICETLNYFNLEHHIPRLINVIIFDAIVGNSDRHQENWGFITYFKDTIDELEQDLKKTNKKRIEKFGIRIKKFITESMVVNETLRKDKEKLKRTTLQLQSDLVINRFSPIYDSGCCLGREKVDKKVEELLKNENMLLAYIDRGESEIHWKGKEKKRKHFELIRLIKEQFEEEVKKTIAKVKSNYNKEVISYVINNIDRNLPEMHSKFKLSDDRKKLMIKLITLRIEKLLKLN